MQQLADFVCRYNRPNVFDSAVCHSSTILSANFLGQLNHAHNGWPTLSIVWHRLLSQITTLFLHSIVIAKRSACRGSVQQRASALTNDKLNLQSRRQSPCDSSAKVERRSLAEPEKETSDKQTGSWSQTLEGPCTINYSNKPTHSIK